MRPHHPSSRRPPGLRAGVALGLLAACSAPGVAPENAVNQRAEPVPVHTRYAGYVRLPSQNGRPGFEPEALVLRDRAAFDAFVDRIPRQKLQKRQPAPPSDDPLLQRPAIDFERRAVIVLIRGDTPWGAIEVERLRRAGDRVHVKREHPPLPADGPMAQPLGVGAYLALVVDRFEGPLLVDD